MKNFPLKFYDMNDAEEVLARFRRVGVNQISLDDVADSLSLPTKGMSFSEAMQDQAGIMAQDLEANGVVPRYASTIAYRVLAVRKTEDLPYLEMWDRVCELGIRADNIHVQADAKRQILAKLFDKFKEGGKQDLSKKNDTYIGFVFNKVYRGAQKRAIEYGLFPKR